MRPSLPPRLAAAAVTTAAALAAATPAHAADAVFGGSSRGGDPIVVKADAGAAELRSIVVSWRAQCSDGSSFPGGGTLTPDETQAVPGFTPSPDELLMSRNAKGRFSGPQLGGTSNAAINVEVDGKLKAGTARGTLRATVKIVDPATGAAVTSCTANQSWVAAREAGVVYAGSTSQGLPFVARYSAKRKRVDDVLTTWFAKCTPDGFFDIADHFGNFQVKSSGAFGAPFEDDVDIDSGGKRHFAYTFAGKLTSKATKGKLQIKVTDTDAAGAPAGGGDTGKPAFEAATASGARAAPVPAEATPRPVPVAPGDPARIARGQKG